MDETDANNGTLIGNTGFSPGVVGQAFVFDGNGDRINLGNPTNLHMQDFTLEAWIRRSSPTIISFDDSVGSIGAGGFIFAYGQAGFALGLLDDGRVFLTRVSIDNTMVSPVITNTAWHHLAVTKSDSTVWFHVDGVRLPPPVPTPYNTTYTFTTPFALGSRGDGLGGTFYGMIDEPTIYNRALSTNEIHAIYLAGAAGKCALLPFITIQPLSQTVGIGSNVTFNVTAHGAPPLVFQWYFDGTPVGSPTAGTNFSSFTLTNTETNQAGDYSVLVVNGYGSLLSSNAFLTVKPFPPSIITQPISKRVGLGSGASFNVSLSGTPPFSYQWRFNGADIVNATNETYEIQAVAVTNTGDYSLVVTNCLGSVTSSPALLTVLIPPTLTLQIWAGYPLLSLDGMLSNDFMVQYCTNLGDTNWINLLSLTNLSTTPYLFLDPAGIGQRMRFYRTIMP